MSSDKMAKFNELLANVLSSRDQMAALDEVLHHQENDLEESMEDLDHDELVQARKLLGAKELLGY